MFNLIRAEGYKLFKNRTFWTLLMIMVVLSTILVFLTYLDEKNVLERIDGLYIEMHEEAMESQQVTGMKIFFEALYSRDLFIHVLLVSILGAFFISNEYANGTIKNLASIGHARWKIFLAKGFVFSVGALIILFSMPFLMGLLGILLFGIGDWPSNSLWAEALKVTFLSLLFYLAFISIALFFSMTFRRSGVALLWSFGFYLFGSVAWNVLASSYAFAEAVNQYSVYYRYTTLLENNLRLSTMIELSFIALFTSIVFIVFGLFIFQRKDLS